jgi:hypothetical protein
VQEVTVKRAEHHTQQTRDNPQTGEITRHEKFSLGRIVATPGALEAVQRAGQSPLDFLARHVNADWGEVCEEDRRENEFALQHGFRLLSVYTTKAGENLWVISEADRSATTLLLPADY